MAKNLITYFDCFSGISGDMTLGALVDAGVPLEEIQSGLSLLNIDGYQLRAGRVKKCGMKATKVDVDIDDSGGQGAKKWGDIQNIVKKSSLSRPLKQKGLLIFKRLFEAEAKVHGSRYDRVHLHELGAVDCIVDIFGSLIGLDILGIDEIYSSPVNLGSGFIKMAHGTLPVPAPATVELLKGIPVYSSDITFELTTPTGAALISSLAGDFCPMPEMRIIKTGVGAGSKNFKTQPNIMRIIIGEYTGRAQSLPAGQAGSAHRVNSSSDSVTVIETNIDDMNPQIYEYVMEQLFKAGALDVFLTPIIMKKGRPGITLSVLCNENEKDCLIDIILKETTSIGVRYYKTERKILKREIKKKKTKYGTINVKISRQGRKSSKTSVEYEDCRKIAEKYNIPLLEVMKVLRQL
jgi:uncharacterized protein (TIGR00299 family) protein